MDEHPAVSANTDVTATRLNQMCFAPCTRISHQLPAADNPPWITTG